MSEFKTRKSYRLNPDLVRFLDAFAKSRRWTETTVIEYALEELAKQHGYMDANGNLLDKKSA